MDVAINGICWKIAMLHFECSCMEAILMYVEMSCILNQVMFLISFNKRTCSCIVTWAITLSRLKNILAAYGIIILNKLMYFPIQKPGACVRYYNTSTLSKATTGIIVQWKLIA